MLLGREPKDYDFTTPLSPDEIEIKVKDAGRRAYLIGKKFGTIGFKVPDENGVYQYVEVTTFRREKYESGSRKPQVEFVSELIEDLSRRDFTINAIALKDGEYFDPFGGRIDIMAKKIKTVGEAKDRFREDPLRMLRSARFSAQLSFEVDPNALGIMRKMSSLITIVSRERWVQEMDKLLVSKGFPLGLRVLVESYLLQYMIPEYWISRNNEEVNNDILAAITLAEQTPDASWAAYLSLIGRSFSRSLGAKYDIIGREVATGICARLKFSNARTEAVLSAIKK